MKITIVAPYDSEWRLVETQSIRLRQLNSRLLAEGFESLYVDASLEQMSPLEVLEVIKEDQPQILVVDFLIRALPFICILVECVRNYFGGHIKIVLLGHAVSNYSDLLFCNVSQIDAIIPWFPEYALPNLVLGLTAGKSLDEIPGVQTRDRKVCDSELFVNFGKDVIVDMPAIDRSYLKASCSDGAEVLSSIGCGGRCSFCNCNDSRIPLKTTWMGYSPDSIIREIEFVAKVNHCTNFHFVDHNFLGCSQEGRERALAIAEGLVQKKCNVRFSIFCRCDSLEDELICRLADAGLWCVNIGIESLSPQALNRYRKDITVKQVKKAVKILRKYDVFFNPTFIMFDPWNSLNDILEIIEFIEDNELFLSFTFSEIIPIPNTYIFDKLLNEHLYVDMTSNVLPIPSVEYRRSPLNDLRRVWLNVSDCLGSVHLGLRKEIDKSIDEWIAGGGITSSIPIEICREFRKSELRFVKQIIEQMMCSSSIDDVIDELNPADFWSSFASIDSLRLEE